MKTCLILFGWLLFPAGFLCGQVAQSAKSLPVVKLSFLPMFHIDNAFVAGLEIPLDGGRFSLQPEIGYGLSESNVWYESWSSDDYPDKQTLRSKLQFRAYFREGGVFRSYYGGEYAYRHSTYTQAPGTIAGASVPATKDIRLRRTTQAMHALLGWQGYFGSRLSIDFHVGFGLRMSENSALTKGLTDAERNEIRIDERDWFRRSDKLGTYGPYPDFIGAVQLGFILGKLH